jgi:hypothetical protein
VSVCVCEFVCACVGVSHPHPAKTLLIVTERNGSQSARIEQTYQVGEIADCSLRPVRQSAHGDDAAMREAAALA